MPSSGYTAITFVASEQPTTAKWNLIGSNDASFNTGDGFNDGIIIPRHLATGAVTSPALALSKTTDANGWKVYDYGANWKEYRKRVTYSNSVGVLTTFPISSGNLPVGVSTIGNATYIGWSITASGNAGALCVVPELASGSTAWNFTATSTDGVTRTYGGFIDLLMITT